MRKVATIIYVMVLSLTAMYAAIVDDTRIASAASMNWYLTDSTTNIPSGANYWMNRGSGDGAADRSFSTSASYIWVSNETANINLDMSGSWTVVVAFTTYQGGSKMDVEVGELSGGTFTARGSATNVGINETAETIGVTTTSHTISSGDYVAIRLTCSTKSFTVDLTGGGTSPTYVVSPTGAPDYPGSEYIDFTVGDYGTNGVDFGTLHRGQNNQPADQDELGGTGAVTLTVGSTTNVDTNIDLYAADFSDGGSHELSISNVKYDDDTTLSEATETGKDEKTLTESYINWYSVSALTTSVVECYHWVDVPSDQYAGAYSTTFYYRCIAQ